MQNDSFVAQVFKSIQKKWSKYLKCHWYYSVLYERFINGSAYWGGGGGSENLVSDSFIPCKIDTESSQNQIWS